MLLNDLNFFNKLINNIRISTVTNKFLKKILKKYILNKNF